jgi:2-octaprenyl-6-methoxyphenol hydroxylase
MRAHGGPLGRPFHRRAHRDRRRGRACIPPIGAQGLNLGLRDAADLAVALDQADDPSDPICLDAYERARRLDVAMRTAAAVDALNRSLLAGMLPIDMLRTAGMAALSSIAPLRRYVMLQGLGGG